MSLSIWTRAIFVGVLLAALDVYKRQGKSDMVNERRRISGIPGLASLGNRGSCDAKREAERGNYRQ